MHVQYLQNVVFNFEIGLNSQNLSSSQTPLQQNFPFPPNGGENSPPPTHDRYLENPEDNESKFYLWTFWAKICSSAGNGHHFKINLNYFLIKMDLKKRS